jgi:hypothetical protein
MCEKIGRATADAWLAVKDDAEREVRIWFDTEGDLLVSADVFVRFLNDNEREGVFKGAPTLDYDKTKVSTERLRKPVIELSNGSCVVFLLKGHEPLGGPPPPPPHHPTTRTAHEHRRRVEGAGSRLVSARAARRG